MDAIDIVAADDERTRIPFKIPVKGRKPLQFSLPRFDYITEDDFDAMTADLEALDTTGQELTLRKKGRQAALVMLQRFVTPDHYSVLETLTTGQLDQIVEGWRAHSVISLGESQASNGSSASTTGPSNTTSSAPATTDAT